MKKNISINISGIIFHIEEDGYELLRKYLDSVNRYFSNFEDSTEILADIEGRIAEIFLSKLNDSKQVITAEDVNALMSIMGSVNDFKAAEESEFATETTSTKDYSQKEKSSGSKQESKGGGGSSTYQSSEPKRLYRDQQRQFLGGVCAGLANYFNVDAVWIRLLFALLMFAYGTAILLYIILWIAVPGSTTLEEPVVSKKLYRDSETKVLGGVSSGIAAYFGIDVVVVRILFLISFFFFGTGFLLYIILWVVLPEAKTVTERMQMQGEPVTLSNIESNIKKNINEDGGKEESTLAKILLLPFRALAAILTAFGKILVPIVEVIRLAFGVSVSLVAAMLIFCLFVVGGVFMGMVTTFPDWLSLGPITNSTFPLEAFTNSFPPFFVVTSFLVILIPLVFGLLLGISIVVKRLIFGATIGWSLFAMFLACVIVLSIMIPRIVYSFKESGEYKVENEFEPNGKTLVLNLREIGLDDYNATKLTLKGHDQTAVKLVQRFEAQGETAAVAIDNAKMVDYNVSFSDSILVFDSNLKFKDKALFRAQELDMVLYIPYNMPFIMDKGVCRFISQYVSWDDFDNETWKMTERGLECITCESTTTADLNSTWSFDEVEISGYVDVTITESDHYSVELIGKSSEKAKYTIEQSGNALVIKYRDFKEDKNFSWRKDMVLFDEVEISISMPNLEKMQAKGAGKINFRDFTSDDVEIELLGAFRARGQLTAHHLLVDIKGASELELSGEANNLDATIAGASRLKAYDFEVRDAIVETIGVSSAQLTASGLLELKEGVGSSIRYRGNPEEVKKN
ncbi:PspC domain-containing protein [Chryseotalea sanaruensis]|uniref:PspC domain-containing protein n=1 Tax=Chryseotalea sanaruensis TaxID=2482724 RepID=A0A401UDQ6_9BACT|nr:PspC domain-containing protein [Chryseotalea sanaruensis]GCC53045.1 PspC domain-containing protein [Chryseotalea sanaruensis]